MYHISDIQTRLKNGIVLYRQKTWGGNGFGYTTSYVAVDPSRLIPVGWWESDDRSTNSYVEGIGRNIGVRSGFNDWRRLIVETFSVPMPNWAIDEDECSTCGGGGRMTMDHYCHDRPDEILDADGTVVAKIEGCACECHYTTEPAHSPSVTTCGTTAWFEAVA